MKTAILQTFVLLALRQVESFKVLDRYLGNVRTVYPHPQRTLLTHNEFGPRASNCFTFAKRSTSSDSSEGVLELGKRRSGSRGSSGSRGGISESKAKKYDNSLKELRSALKRKAGDSFEDSYVIEGRGGVRNMDGSDFDLLREGLSRERLSKGGSKSIRLDPSRIIGTTKGVIREGGIVDTSTSSDGTSDGTSDYSDDSSSEDSPGSSSVDSDGSDDSSSLEESGQTSSSSEELYDEGLEDSFDGLRNLQVQVPVDSGLLERQMQTIKDIMGLRNSKIEVELVPEELIRDLNLSYRGKDESTDILSFPYEAAEDGLPPAPLPPSKTPTLESLREAQAFNGTELGFISICPAYVQRVCDEDRLQHEASLLAHSVEHPQEPGVSGFMSKVFTVEERLPLLLIHGILHLMRWDHESTGDFNAMAGMEESIAREFLKRSREHKPCFSGHYVIGVGTDMCYMPRIREIIESKEGDLVDRICSVRERALYEKLKLKYLEENKLVPKKKPWLDVAASYLAKRFATKEAVAKALGTGLRHVSPDGIRLRDIEVWSRPSGQPTVELVGPARAIQHSMGVSTIIVSQTDERDYALSFATACGSTGHALVGDEDWVARYGS